MLKVLSIGNSFSSDATAYTHRLAQSAGIDLLTENLFIGGCSLERHWQNILFAVPDYSLEVNGEATGEKVTSEAALKSQNWDFVTLQQASHFSPDYATYQPYLDKVAGFVRKNAPTAEIVMHQTWAYEEGSERLQKIVGYQRQAEMFAAIQEAYSEAAKALGGCRIIPCGWVFQQFLKQGFGNLHRDSFHASIPQGRYILAAVWYEFFTGWDVTAATFCPEGMSQSEGNWLKTQVHQFLSQR